MTATVLPDRLEHDRLSFEILHRPNRRTLEITVERDASLTIKVPDGVSLDQIEAFVDSKQEWIYRKLAEKDTLGPDATTKQFVNGEGFAYLGRNYRLQLVTRQDVPVRLTRGRLVMARSVAKDGTAAMREWYRHTGQPWLLKRLRPWAARLGIDDVEIHVIDLGYRWGSTRGDERLNVHWATLQLPPSLIDYVIVHELAHLHETNHTPEFWATVDRAMPEACERRRQLIVAGQQLWLGS